MSFADDLRRFTIKTDRTTRAVYVAFAGAVQESIKVGSAVTGAPGQPVDTGFLRNSWTLELGPVEAIIGTNVAYAPVIEYNDRAKFNPQGDTPPTSAVRPAIKSTVGGNHSVKLTVAGADRLLAAVTREVTR